MNTDTDPDKVVISTQIQINKYRQYADQYILYVKSMFRFNLIDVS